MIPIVGRELGERVARIVTGIVDEHADGARLGFDLAQMRLVRLNVGDIANAETRRVFASCGKFCDQRRTRCGIDIAKRHARALLREVFNQRRADTGSATGDEHHAVFKTGISCYRVHRGFFRFGRASSLLMRQLNIANSPRTPSPQPLSHQGRGA